MTQNVFSEDRREDLGDCLFYFFHMGSLHCCRDYFCGSLSGCKHVRGSIKFPDNTKFRFSCILVLSVVCNDNMLNFKFDGYDSESWGNMKQSTFS